MAVENAIDDEDLQSEQLDEEEDEAEVEQTEDESESESDESPEEDELEITFGEETPASEDESNQRAPEWIRELRKTNREKDRENRELKARLAQLETTAVKPVELGPKPKLEDFEFDADAYDKARDEWHERKQRQEDQKKLDREAQEQEQKAWASTLETYGKEKSALKVKDFEEAEGVVTDKLSTVQQALILKGAKQRPQLVYALYRSPTALKELSSITDPVEFAFAAGRLESKLNVKPRKSVPQPEKRVSGSASVSGSVDSTLKRLEAEAEKTGDRTKVAEYRRQQRRKNA